MTTILIAGIGNILRGDDGFGPAVVRALEAGGDLPSGVRTVELGIGGIGLVHELMDGFEALVIVDAVDRGGVPGTLYILEPEVPEVATLVTDDRHALATDLHEAVLGRTLVIARAVGVLPPAVRIVGCQPAELDEFTTALSMQIQQRVPVAVNAVRSMLAELAGAGTEVA